MLSTRGLLYCWILKVFTLADFRKINTWVVIGHPFRRSFFLVLPIPALWVPILKNCTDFDDPSWDVGLHWILVVVQRLAAKCGFFWDEPLLPVLLVAVDLVLANVGTLGRIALGKGVATVDIVETSLLSVNLSSDKRSIESKFLFEWVVHSWNGTDDIYIL